MFFLKKEHYQNLFKIYLDKKYFFFIIKIEKDFLYIMSIEFFIINYTCNDLF